MKRDMDLVRRLLLIVEGETYPRMVTISPGENSFNSEAPMYKHFDLLKEADFLRGNITNSGSDSEHNELYYIDTELTWKGYEFLDSVRDPDIWKKTKEGANKIGGASVEFLWDIAKAYGKHVVKEKLGLDLS